MESYGLGRIHLPDERDRNYLLKDHLSPVARTAGERLWRVPTLYNQGQLPQCTCYSSSGYMTARDWMTGRGTVQYNPQTLYTWANSHDGITGPHDGSTVRAAFQGLIAIGDKIQRSYQTDEPVGHFDQITTYLWADLSQPNSDIATITTWLLDVGPVVVGSNWYTGMDTPDEQGVIHATGSIRGGHAYLVRGILTLPSLGTLFVVRNSWGPWGGYASFTPEGALWSPTNSAGDALLTEADLITLLSQDGECASAEFNGGAKALGVGKPRNFISEATAEIHDIFHGRRTHQPPARELISA